MFIVLGNHNAGHFGYQHLPEVYFERIMDSYLNDIKNKSNCTVPNGETNVTTTSNETISEIAEADFKVTAMRKLLR